MPIQSERANYWKSLSMFCFILLRKLATRMQTLPHSDHFKLKNFRLEQLVLCQSCAVILAWRKSERFHVSTQCFNFLFKRQSLRCIRPPVDVAWRWQWLSSSSELKVAWKEFKRQAKYFQNIFLLRSFHDRQNFWLSRCKVDDWKGKDEIISCWKFINKMNFEKNCV